MQSELRRRRVRRRGRVAVEESLQSADVGVPRLVAAASQVAAKRLHADSRGRPQRRTRRSEEDEHVNCDCADVASNMADSLP
eukprot:3433471-Prymnesium_polylepis.1